MDPVDPDFLFQQPHGVRQILHEQHFPGAVAFVDEISQTFAFDVFEIAEYDQPFPVVGYFLENLPRHARFQVEEFFGDVRLVD